MIKSRKRTAKQALLDNIGVWSNEAKMIKDKVDAASKELGNMTSSPESDSYTESERNGKEGMFEIEN